MADAAPFVGAICRLCIFVYYVDSVYYIDCILFRLFILRELTEKR